MELWQVIKILEGQMLETIDRGFRFDVLDVSKHIIVKRYRTTKERKR